MVDPIENSTKRRAMNKHDPFHTDVRRVTGHLPYRLHTIKKGIALLCANGDLSVKSAGGRVRFASRHAGGANRKK